MSDRVQYRYVCEGAYRAGENRHPQVVIRECFPDASDFVPQSMGDQWWFTATKRQDLPAFIEVK